MSNNSSPRKGSKANNKVAPPPLPALNPGDVWYFAFGSNLNPTVLTGRRRVFPRASLPVKLDGWALSFNLRGIPYVEPGMASLVKVDPSTTPVAPPQGPIVTGQQAHQARVAAGLHGVAHLINAEEWERVKLTEGVKLKGLGYQVVPVECETYAGQKVEALTLVAAPASAGDPAGFLPSARYMGLIREGARLHGVDPAYCAMLEAHPVYDASSGRWGVRAGQFAVAGVMLAVTLPLVPLALATAAYNSIMGTTPPPMFGGPPSSKGQGSTPGTPTNDPSASTNGGGKPGSQNTTTPDKSVVTTTIALPGAVSAAAGLKAEETKPPPGGMAVMWMRQQMPSFIGPYFMFALGKAVQVAHDWVLQWVLGNGYTGSPVLVPGDQQRLTAAPGAGGAAAAALPNGTDKKTK